MAVCPNCGSSAIAAYCPECGQEQADGIPTVREWLREVLDELFLVDRTLPHTFRTLLVAPGELTAEWAAGRRARHMTPLRVYLLTGAMLVGSGALLGYLNHEVFLLGSDQRSTAGDLLAFCLLSIAVPLLAVGARVAMIGSGPHPSFMPFVVFSLHAHAAFMVFAALAFGLAGTAGGASAAALIYAGAATAAFAYVYLVPALRRAFSAGWTRSVLGGALTMAFYVLGTQLLLGIGVTLWFALPGH